MLHSWFQHIIQKVIKDIVASNTILQLSNFSNDGLKKFDQETFSRFNTSLGFLNNILNSLINLSQNSLDSRGSGFNFGLNNSLDFFQEVKNIVLNFTRFNLSFNLLKDVLQSSSSFHDIHNGNVFLGFQLICKVSKVFGNGRDKVLNGMLHGWFQHIIQKVIKDIVASNTILQLSNFSNDGLKKFDQETFSRFNTSLSFGNNILNSLINLSQNSLDSRGSGFNFRLNNSLDLFQIVKNIVLNFARFNLSFYLLKDVLQSSSSFHDIH